MKLRIAAIVREDLAGAVSKGGFSEVFVVKEKSEALAILERITREKSFDLVVLDDTLAAELGRGTLARLKHENPFPAIIEMKTSRLKRVRLS
ncbi:MAG: V-type ATP synthase subunit F [Thermofilum sp.]